MKRQRVEIPWPLGRAPTSIHGHCVLSWAFNDAVRYTAWREGRMYETIQAAFGIGPVAINDANGYGLSSDERALTLYGALYYAGYDPVIVDTHTGDVIG